MNAWQLLTASSSLPSGTAWQHLNSIEGGGGGSLVIYEQVEAYLMPDIESEISEPELTAELAQDDIESTLEPEIGSDIE